jgi:hypothetical protein
MASLTARLAFCGFVLMTGVMCYSTRPASPFTAALTALCEVPDLRSANKVEVIGETTAVLQLPALRAYFDPVSLTGRDIAALTEAEEKLLRDFRSEPFSLPRDSGCAWQMAEGHATYSDRLRIELSFVVPRNTASNPSEGVFARVSDGGRPGADFYWLPIEVSGKIGVPVKLSVDDG